MGALREKGGRASMLGDEGQNISKPGANNNPWIHRSMSIQGRINLEKKITVRPWVTTDKKQAQRVWRKMHVTSKGALAELRSDLWKAGSRTQCKVTWMKCSSSPDLKSWWLCPNWYLARWRKRKQSGIDFRGLNKQDPMD